MITNFSEVYFVSIFCIAVVFLVLFLLIIMISSLNKIINFGSKQEVKPEVIKQSDETDLLDDELIAILTATAQIMFASPTVGEIQIELIEFDEWQHMLWTKG